MANPFLSSEEYDERAHNLYNDGDYDGAIQTLKEGLRLYPHSVELYVGLGYTRLAREEFAWAKQAFERALVLDPEHEDAMVGLGEVLLRFGRREEALELFARARRTGAADDLDLLLSMGRALYREQLYAEAREIFAEAAMLHPGSAEAVAALGYTLHRLGDEPGARRHLMRALKLDPTHHEARVYLGHLLYDRGDWKEALEELERVPPSEHWDSVAIWRVIELKRALQGCEPGDEELAPWEARLEELESATDPIDELLAEIESGIFEAEELEPPGRVVAVGSEAATHQVCTPDGAVLTGTWLEIVEQLRDRWGHPEESVAQFMRRQAEEERSRSGRSLPSDDPELFLLASARAGLLRIVR
ncbi:MAG TPA: tetratricopeptide repeat protein [Longimicrobiales bacterium]